MPKHRLVIAWVQCEQCIARFGGRLRSCPQCGGPVLNPHTAPRHNVAPDLDRYFARSRGRYGGRRN